MSDDEFDVFDLDTDLNGNTGHLKGLQCPKCEKYDNFSVSVTVVLDLFDNQTGEVEEETLEYLDDAWAACGGCSHNADVGTFKEAYKTIQQKKRDAPPEPDDEEDYDLRAGRF